MIRRIPWKCRPSLNLNSCSVDPMSIPPMYTNVTVTRIYEIAHMVTTATKVDAAFTVALPKCELHAHLTGSIDRHCLHEIWLRKRGSGLCLDLQDPLDAIVPGQDFVDVRTFFPLFDKYIYGLCDDLESVKFATLRVLEAFERDGVRYLELRTTPRQNASGTMSREAYVAAVQDVLSTWNLANGKRMEAYLILSLDRKMTPTVAESVVDLAIHYRYHPESPQSHSLVVAIDLCGNPAVGNPLVFSPAVQRARQHGLRLTVHFAEVPESSSEVELETLLGWQPDRLGHAIHAPEQIKAVIEQRQLALELCLSCNVLSRLTLGGFPKHHFADWLKTNCPLSLGTDDVGVFDSPLSREYLLAAEHFNLNAGDLIALSRRAVSGAFVGQDRMNALLDEFASTKE